MNKETYEQILLYNWFSEQYSNAIFHSDIAGVKLTVGQQVQLNKLGKQKGFPDVFIAEPNEKYHGLFIELKASGTEIRKVRSDAYKSKHLEIQAEYLKLLKSKGYFAAFGKGVTVCKSIINYYMQGDFEKLEFYFGDL